MGRKKKKGGRGGSERRTEKEKSNAQDNLRRKRGWEKEITESDESVLFCYFHFSNPPKHTQSCYIHVCSIPLILLLGFELHSLNIVGFESSVLKDTHLSSDLKWPLPISSNVHYFHLCMFVVSQIKTYARARTRGAEKAGVMQGEQLSFSMMHL